MLECDGAARRELEEFVSRHPTDAHIEKIRGADGISIVNLVVTNLPAIMSSLAALVAVLKAKEIGSLTLTKGGREVSLNDLEAMSREQSGRTKKLRARAANKKATVNRKK